MFHLLSNLIFGILSVNMDKLTYNKCPTMVCLYPLNNAIIPTLFCHNLGLPVPNQSYCLISFAGFIPQATLLELDITSEKPTDRTISLLGCKNGAIATRMMTSCHPDLDIVVKTGMVDSISKDVITSDNIPFFVLNFSPFFVPLPSL